ncbi:transcriptional regulator GcvA [Ferrovibrio sp. MS7]|uniref:transcriptional regulator GcvA n=1 Tax=Ferrovibrio plantarum TaxID=3119164 RepID=UPI0031347E01
MGKRLPPLLALEAFDAAARHMSFKAAAGELNLTPSAISHRVKALERHLGLPLFRRLNREIRFTEAGQDYFGSVRRALDEVARASQRLQAPSQGDELRVSAVPFIAAAWLIPNLESFLDSQPGLRLYVESTQRNADFARDPVDAAIRWGHGRWPGLSSTRLASISVTPVASPKLMQGRGALRALTRPRDLRDHTLIHLSYLPKAWDRWLAAAGVAGLKPKREIWVDNMQQAIDAAERGIGITLGVTPLLAPRLLEQRLVMPFGLELSENYAYWFVCRRAEADRPRLKALRDWLVQLLAQADVQMKLLQAKRPF